MITAKKGEELLKFELGDQNKALLKKYVKKIKSSNENAP